MRCGIRLTAAVLLLATLVGCTQAVPDTGAAFDPSQTIAVLNREGGSGTKISFLDFLGLTEEALPQALDNIVSGTEVMLSAVESDRYAVGYLSHNQLGAGVRAVAVDSVLPTAQTVASGTYPFTRTFYLVTTDTPDALVSDFLAFVPASGTAVTAHGYIPMDTVTDYHSAQPAGSLRISGSSSLYPLMLDLVAQYKTINPHAKIEISETDSTNGIANVLGGISDIAMSSRALRQQELTGTQQLAVAKDAIAVIVHADNPTQSLTIGQLQDIYTGKLTTWQDCLA